MATVGLSFGNPTSGTGFDVSTTVSEIMASYQATETPWNTQLSTLSTQDAAFSTIGDDLSTLSAALSTLTDFQGVLASKEGSSSDSNVLALTGASTAAVAGSHSITVTQLAQTSSWSTSSTPMTATDTFTGSFTIAVGSGAPQTINATGDTLSTLVNSINSASLGVTASVLTDSSGEYLSLTSGTSGVAGALTVNGSTSSSSSTLTYGSGTAVTLSQSVAGQDAVMTVDGNTVTSSSNTVTDAIPGVTFQLLDTTGTTASPGTPVQVEITNDTADVTSAMDTFVSAYNVVINALNTQEGDDASGNPEPLFGNTDIALLQEQLGAAANMSENSIWSSSATPIAATDQLAAGTLSIQVGSGTATSITVNAGDTLNSVANTINNTAGIGVTASVVTGASGSYLSIQSSTTGTAGDLTVTGSLSDTTTAGATVSFADTNIASTTNSFGALGISVNADGTLALDTDTFSSLLNGDYESIINFFQDASSIGTNFSNVISGLGSSSPTGIISEAIDSISSQESTLNADITNENVVISSEQAQLTTELEQANETLQAIPSQVNEVNELYSAITGYGETQS
jgi:flagellar hook-associated protein 2